LDSAAFDKMTSQLSSSGYGISKASLCVVAFFSMSKKIRNLETNSNWYLIGNDSKKCFVQRLSKKEKNKSSERTSWTRTSYILTK